MGAMYVFVSPLHLNYNCLWTPVTRDDIYNSVNEHHLLSKEAQSYGFQLFSGFLPLSRVWREPDCAMRAQPSTTIHPVAVTQIAGTRPKGDH